MANKLILFIQKDATYFSTDINDFNRIVRTLGKMSPFEVQIVDVSKNPELAEKYKIDALPTLIIGNKKYIGKPQPDKFIEMINKEE